MTEEQKHIHALSKEISTQLHKLESAFWDAYISPQASQKYLSDFMGNAYSNYDRDDNITYLFHGTKSLFYKICLFLELKRVPLYYNFFLSKFQPIIDNEKLVRVDRGPLYNDDEPSMIILDDFRDFLLPFQEFSKDYYFNKLEVNKLKQILENTNSIISKTNSIITNETSIYTPVKWFIEIIYPSARSRNKARFIKKFKTYHPDILIPEISSAVEYKFIRKGADIDTYLDQIKVDADNYEKDPEYKFFYAVVYFENKNEINPEAFKQAILEKKFPENWLIIAL